MAGNFVDSLLIGIGLDTKGVATGLQEVGRTIDSGLKSAFDNAVKGASPLGEALKGLKKDAEEVRKPIDETAAALKDFGVRTESQIRELMEKVRTDFAKAMNDPRLTDRDRMLVWEKAKAQLEGYEKELKTGLPAAAQQGFAGAEAAAGRFKGFLSSIWAQISGPLMGAFAIGGTVSSYISNAMSAGELADKLKVDVEEIQIWSGAMDRAGGSAASLQATIEKLNASGKAQGDAIGVLLDLADKATTMSKEAFVAKAKELEIDEKTIEVLAQGRKALDEHLKRQRDLGAYTKEDAEQSKKFKQSMSDLLQAWDGFTSFIGRFTVPIMQWLADILTDVVVYMRQHTPFVAAAIGTVGAALAARLMPPLRELPKLVANVSKAFLRWMPFVAVIAGIALLIDDFYAYISGGKSALEDFWAIFGTGPEILAKLNAAWGYMKAALASVGTGLAQIVRYWYDLMKASGMFASLGQTFKGLLQVLKGLFTLDWSLLGEGLANVFNGLVRGVAAGFKGLGILARDAMQAVLSGLRSYVPGFAKWADGIADTLSGILHLDPGKIMSGLGKMLSGVGTMLVSGIKGVLKLSANAWSAIIEVFTGVKIDLAGWVNEAWNKAAAKLAEIKNWVLGWVSGLFGGGEAPDFGAIAEKIWSSIKETCSKIKEWVVNWVKNLFSGIKLPSIGDLLGGAGDVAGGAADLVKSGLGKVGDFFGGLFKDAEPETAKAGAKVQDGMAKTAGEVEGGFTAAWTKASGAAVSLFGGAASEIRSIFGSVFAELQAQAQSMVAGARAMAGGGAMVPAFAGVRAQNAGAQNVSQSSSVHIGTMNVQTRATDANGVAKGMQGALGRNRLVQSSQTGTVQK